MKIFTPFQFFLKTFAQDNEDPSSISIHKRFSPKTKEWIKDGEGNKALFLHILSFLDQYDLAVSIEPACKLFKNFADCDMLWEQLYWNVLGQEYGKKYLDVLTPFVKRGDSIAECNIGCFLKKNIWKFKVINGVRQYYYNDEHLLHFGYSFMTGSGGECFECSDSFADEMYMRNYSGRSMRDYHMACIPSDVKEDVRSKCKHFYQLVAERDYISFRSPIIETFFGRRLAKQISYSSDEEEEENEEELPSHTCDGCQQYITSIRYKCLDCEEYDLCGYCCESVIYSSKGWKNGLNVSHPTDHTFLPVGETLTSYGCDLCKEKIIAYRYENILDGCQFDLCHHCFETNRPKDKLYHRFNLNQEDETIPLFDQFFKMAQVGELKHLIEIQNIETNGKPKKDLIKAIENEIIAKKFSMNQPTLCFMVSETPRLCVKGQADNILLAESASDAEIFSIEVSVPTKKAKLV